MNTLQAWADRILTNWLRSIVEFEVPQLRTTSIRNRVQRPRGATRTVEPTPEIQRRLESYRVKLDEAGRWVIFDQQDSVVYAGTKQQCEDWLDLRENSTGNYFVKQVRH